MSSTDKTSNPPKHRRDAPVGKGAETGSREQDMGRALRSVYQQTVDESVPDEFMDLLGKLG